MKHEKPRFSDEWVFQTNMQTWWAFIGNEDFLMTGLALFPSDSNDRLAISKLPHNCDEVNRRMLDRFYETVGADPQSATTNDVTPENNHNAKITGYYQRNTSIPTGSDYHFVEIYTRQSGQESFGVYMHKNIIG